MALDYARRIRVNSVSPGAVDTPLQRRMLADPEVAERHREYLDLYVPMQREASAREVGLVVAFLASDDASYITGTNILVDGGLLAGRHSDPRALRDAAADRSQRSTDQ
jgi:cyclopentanol dehydrogenase